MMQSRPAERTTSGGRRRRASAIVFLAVTVPIVAAHLGTLTIPFIGDAYGFHMHLEDARGIDWAGVWREFGSTWGGVSDLQLYRPLSTVTATLDYVFFGLPAFGMHLHHVLLHVLNALLVAAIVRLFSPRHAIGPAIAAGLFFGLHTIATDCLCNVMTRPDLQAAFFALASLLAYFRYARGGRRRFLAISMVIALAGLTAKEIALTIPVIAGVASGLYFLRTRDRRWLAVIAAYVVLLVAMLGFRHLVLGKVTTAYEPLEPWFTVRQVHLVLENLAVSLRLLFFPVDAVHVPAPAFWWVGITTCAILVVLFARGGPGKFLRPTHIAAGLVLAMPLGMIAWFWHFGTNLYALHRNHYLPLAGAALLVFLPTARLQLPRRVTAILIAILVAVMASTVHRGVSTWGHEGRRIEAVARHARAEGARTPGRWVMMAGIPDWGVWLPLAMRPPHSPRDLGRVVPLSMLGIAASPGYASAVIAAGGRICLWNEAGLDFARIPGGEAFRALGPGTLEARLPDVDRWRRDATGTLVSPPIRISPYALRAIEVSGGGGGTWSLGWTRGGLRGALSFDLRPDAKAVVPLFTTPDWFLPLAVDPNWPETAIVTELRLDPPPGVTGRPALRYLPRLPELAVEVPEAPIRIRPADGWTLRFPTEPRHLRLHFINQGWLLSVERPASGPAGEVRLERADLMMLLRLTDVRGPSPVLFYAETLADPKNRYSVRARTRFIELTVQP